MNSISYPHVVLIDGQPHLPIELIDPDIDQHRKRFRNLQQLAASFQEFGILQPLKLSYNPATGRYLLIAGERRYRAALIAGLKLLPVSITKATKRKCFTMGVIENVQRDDPQPMEEAEAYRKMLKENLDWTTETIASVIGKTKDYVDYRLALLELHPMLRGMVQNAPEPDSGQISIGQAYQIVTASRLMPVPRHAQYTIFKAYQKGTSLRSAVSAIRQQAAMTQQQSFFALAALTPYQAKRAARARQTLEEKLAKITKLCSDTWDAKRCQLVVSAFSRNDLDRTILEIELLEKHLARVRKDLTTERTRKQIFRRAKKGNPSVKPLRKAA